MSVVTVKCSAPECATTYTVNDDGDYPKLCPDCWRAINNVTNTELPVAEVNHACDCATLDEKQCDCELAGPQVHPTVSNPMDVLAGIANVPEGTELTATPPNEAEMKMVAQEITQEVLDFLKSKGYDGDLAGFIYPKGFFEQSLSQYLDICTAANIDLGCTYFVWQDHKTERWVGYDGTKTIPLFGPKDLIDSLHGLRKTMASHLLAYSANPKFTNQTAQALANAANDMLKATIDLKDHLPVEAHAAADRSLEDAGIRPGSDEESTDASGSAGELTT